MPSRIPSLRSPRAKVGRLVYFGRMLDKIRLHLKGELPEAWVANLASSTDNPNMFDARCCRFLGVTYADIVARVREGLDDAQVLEWAHRSGTPRSDEDCEIWNSYMCKLGWNDAVTERLQTRIAEYGLSGRGIVTYFEMIEADEGL